MIKTCKRCENEPKIPGLPVGDKCLTALRTELAEYDATLAEDELARARRRRDELALTLEPHVAEMDHLEGRIEELTVKSEAETAEQMAERQKLEAAGQATDLRAENARLETEALAAENAQLETEALSTENARLEAEVLAAENALLTAELDKK